MGQRDPRVDAYIARAAPFARPILAHLRELVHRGAPGIAETIKWGMPFFTRKRNLCHMAAFKAHCAFGFWTRRVVGTTGKEREAMGQFGRIASLDDLPADEKILALVREAVAVDAKGEKRSARPGKAKPEAAVPEDLAKALRSRKHAAAKETFDAFPPSHRHEYVEWIAEAKTEATRAKRLATTLEWLNEGRPRNWKYTKRPKSG